MMSYPAMSLEDRFCVSRKGVMGRWVGVPKGCKQHGLCLGLALKSRGLELGRLHKWT